MKKLWHKLNQYKRLTSTIFWLFFFWWILIDNFIFDRLYVRKYITITTWYVFIDNFISFVITFSTLWALLFKLKIYKILHDIFVKLLWDWELYNLLKWGIWIILIGITSKYLIPFLNWILTLFYNIWLIIVHLLPNIWISLLITFCIVYLYFRINKK